MEVHDLYHYDPLTGYFTYKVRTANRVRVGDRAETPTSDGYWCIRFQGKQIRAGRLAFFYMTGRWPDPEVDHIDGNPMNDAWLNLREATSSQQKMNTKRRSDNASGVKVVSWNKITKRWRADIMLHGKHKFLGHFYSIAEAKAAYNVAKNDLFGEFARS